MEAADSKKVQWKFTSFEGYYQTVFASQPSCHIELGGAKQVSLRFFFETTDRHAYNLYAEILNKTRDAVITVAAVVNDEGGHTIFGPGDEFTH